MKTDILVKLTKVLFVFLVVLLFIVPVFAYPPDNAALLYYQVCSFYNPQGEIKDMLSDFAKGKIEPNETIINHIEQNKHVTEIILDAAEIENCDWALDYSKGLNMLMPPLGCLKASVYLTLADGRMYAEHGDFKTAFQRCLSVQKMARHVSEQTYVSYLVATSMHALSNLCIQNMLSSIGPDLETLVWLNNSLVAFDEDNSWLIVAHNGEKQWCALEMRKERAQNIIGAMFSSKCLSRTEQTIHDQLLTADDDFFAKNREYYFNAMETLEGVLQSQLPYPQKQQQLAELTKQFEKEYQQNPDALLTPTFLPGIQKIYSLGIRAKTVSNATQAALDLYIIKAKTGKLPDTLPARMPKDLFSGKDFQYEKTGDGFILRCQGKELNKDATYEYEYEFKVKK